MKRLRTLFLVAAVGAAGGWQSYAQEGASNPSLQFKKESWDFGRIKETDGNVSHVFTFTNRSDKPFVIERVVATCGCTTPEYSREPILPGRNGTIKVTYNPVGRPGPFSKNVTVTLHDGNQAKLLITGTVIGRTLSVDEEYPIVVGEGLRASRKTAGMGYLPRGGTKGVAIEYLNGSGKSIILGVEYEKVNDYFVVVFSPETLPPGGKGLMTVSYKLQNTEVLGRVTDNFYVTVNGVRAREMFQATGIVTEDFSQLTPEQLSRAPKADFSAQYYHFGDTKSGETRSRDFTVTNSGKEPLVIQKVTPGEYTTLTLNEGTTLAPGQSLIFRATLNTKSRPAGRCMDSSSIIVNDPQRPVRELRLVATIYD